MSRMIRGYRRALVVIGLGAAAALYWPLEARAQRWSSVHFSPPEGIDAPMCRPAVVFATPKGISRDALAASSTGTAMVTKLTAITVPDARLSTTPAESPPVSVVVSLPHATEPLATLGFAGDSSGTTEGEGARINLPPLIADAGASPACSRATEHRKRLFHLAPAPRFPRSVIWH
jgi:hypothetical protein